jgi:hypothetical protein
MRKLLSAVAAMAIVVPLAIGAIPASAHGGKPTVGCYSYTAGHTQRKAKPNSCALVVSLRGCDGACAADQIYIDNCAWRRWAPRHARGHCTERANGGFHKRLSVKFRRVRGHRFTRGRIGGHKVHLPR